MKNNEERTGTLAVGALGLIFAGDLCALQMAICRRTSHAFFLHCPDHFLVRPALSMK